MEIIEEIMWRKAEQPLKKAVFYFMVLQFEIK
jgi:hypothetical protein